MISVQLEKKIADNIHLVIFTKDKNKFDASMLSPTEADYVKKELEADKKLISINQFTRTVFIQVIEKKSEKYKTLEALRKAGDSLAAALNGMKATEVLLSDDKADDELLAYAEGIALGSYKFNAYKADREKESNSLNTIKIKCAEVKPKRVDHLNILIDAIYRCRDLVNTPNSHQTAQQLAVTFEKMGYEANFKVEVFNKQKIETLKMGGLLAVNKGSVEPPTFSVMEYKPNRHLNKKPIVLVGKGVVYDTGGLSIKPTAGMDTMKCDMAGSAVVSCTMYAIAKAKLPLHVIALVPATDNRPGGNAYAPGDVIEMMSGKNVEMLNADAEGRMILADALHFAKQYEPKLVCEFSTLTGAAAAAIGQYGIVCMGTADERTKKDLKDAGNEVYERLAEFPFWDEYDELLKSDIADMKNIGGPVAGAITAGKFLARYVDYPYMHFDIAGPAFTAARDSYRGKGGTGSGVRLMFEFLKEMTK